MQLNVLYQTSDMYAPIAGVGITSLLENNRHFDAINLYILDDGITPENKNKLVNHIQSYNRTVHFLDASKISERLEALSVAKWRNTYTIYCKLFASSLLPESMESILYLDSDTAVAASLDELAATDLSGAPCAMVVAPNYNKHKVFIGLPEDTLYFEAGTIFFNLRYWRENRCEDRIVQYLKDPSSRYYAADQDILNVLYSKQIIKLPLKFGVCTGIYLYSAKQVLRIYDLNGEIFYPVSEIETAKEHPSICHFSGGGINGRPWEAGNRQTMGYLWDRYLALSPWKDWKKIEASESFYLKLQRFLYRLLPSSIYAVFHRLALHYYFKRKVSALVRERTAGNG